MLMNITLQLLLNLSFDPGLRDEMVKEAFVVLLTKEVIGESPEIPQTL